MIKRIFIYILLIFSFLIIVFFFKRNLPLLILYKTLFFLIVQQKIEFNFPDHFIKYMFLTGIGLGFIYFFGRIALKKILSIIKERKKIPWEIYFLVGISVAGYLLMFPAIFFYLNRLIIIFILVLVPCILYAWKRKGGKEEETETEETIEDKRGVVFWTGTGLVTLITLLSFYHALFYPETYWDSLIYYLHYGKMTYREHGFPILYCAQVGLGLGANYPHVYHLICATLAILFGQYTDFYGQFLSPFMGLIATILVYRTGKLIFESKEISILVTLIFRSIPFCNVYFTYATDYSFVIAYATAFVYTATQHLKTKKTAYLLLCAVFMATLPNINYLGWIFLPVFILLLIMGYKKENHSRGFFSPVKLLLLIFILGIPWYIRNWIVTGNPVYAFYPQIFDGKHINLQVLASCYKEWSANGIGVPGNTIWERLAKAPKWFFYIWQLNPVLFALTLPGIIYFLLFRNKENIIKTRTGWICLSIFGLGLFYHLFISNLYLYQIVFIIPSMAILGFYAVSDYWDKDKAIRFVTVVLVILIAIVPGVSMSIMGPKLSDTSLIAFRYPGLSKKEFYRLKFPEESRVWEYINQNLHNAVILTHENRYHVFNDDITIRHLDDWDIQPLYNEPDIEKKAKALYEKGIRYYLYIPNEKNHPIVAKLEIPKMIDRGYLHLIFESGDYRLYEFEKPN